MDIQATLDESETRKCFHCQVKLFSGDKYLLLFANEGPVHIKNRTGEIKPMIFCSSDCMVIDFKTRYDDRTARGNFQRRFDVKYDDAHLPVAWRLEAATLVR